MSLALWAWIIVAPMGFIVIDAFVSNSRNSRAPMGT